MRSFINILNEYTDIKYELDLDANSQAHITKTLDQAKSILANKNVGWLADCPVIVAQGRKNVRTAADGRTINTEVIGEYDLETDTLSVNPYEPNLLETILHEYGHRFEHKISNPNDLSRFVWNGFAVSTGKHGFLRDQTWLDDPDITSQMDHRFIMSEGAKQSPNEWWAELFAYWCMDHIKDAFVKEWMDDMIHHFNN